MSIGSKKLPQTIWQRVVSVLRATPDTDAPAFSCRTSASAPHVSGRRGKLGRVTLIGAGPGDAELLTLKAARAIGSADVILHDALVSAQVLDFASSGTRLIPVGKRSRRVSCRQDDINDLMVRLAREGNHVARLKSGDPTIFGRAGEELARLDGAGIAYDIIPGITSSAAMAASLGVSLTHRDHAHSVRFVTGHAVGGSFPEDLDWRGLADPQTTTIVYMGARTAAEIAARMIKEGRSGDTPVVAVANISRPNEKRWSGSLADLANSTTALDLKQPVLIGIGGVFAATDAAGSASAQHQPASRSTAVKS